MLHVCIDFVHDEFIDEWVPDHLFDDINDWVNSLPTFIINRVEIENQKGQLVLVIEGDEISKPRPTIVDISNSNSYFAGDRHNDS